MQASGKNINVDGLLETVYATALDLSKWQEAVDIVARAAEAAAGGQFQIIDLERRALIHSCMPAWQPREAELEYNERYFATDPRISVFLTLGPGEWLFDSDHFDRKFVSRTAVYRFLDRNGIGFSGGATLHQADGIRISLGLLRARDQPGFDTGQRALLTRLTPHLMRAAKLGTQLEFFRAQAALGQTALDALSSAVMIVDAKRRVLFHNAAAERLLRERSGFTVSNQALTGVLPEISEALGSAVRRAVENGVGGLVRVPTGDPWSALACRIVRTPQSGPLAGLARGRTAVVVIDGGPLAPDPAIVTSIFGFTPAESRVAQLVSGGATLRQISTALEIGLETVRTHLKQVFLKTGTRRQAELVALLRATVA